MPIIPLKQTVTYTPSSSKDKWGRSTEGTPVDYKCRVEEQSEVVTNQTGEEVSTSLKIYFDKLPNLSYDGTISYTDELGATVTKEIVSIDVTRDIAGKPILTVARC